MLSYGGWLEYTSFRVDFDRECKVGGVKCSGAIPNSYWHPHITGTITGRYSESTPAGVGSATWTGVMVGMARAYAFDAPVAQPDVYLGDARITIDNLAAPDVNVSFTNIHNVTDGTRHPDMTWKNLRVRNGVFGRDPRYNVYDRHREFGMDYILGMFNGPQHQEVGGEFESGVIAGAFGAKRQ